MDNTLDSLEQLGHGMQALLLCTEETAHHVRVYDNNQCPNGELK